MNFDQVTGIKEPEDKKKGTYVINYNNGDRDYTAYLSKTEFDYFQIVQEIKKRGYDKELLEKFEDVVTERYIENESWNQE